MTTQPPAPPQPEQPGQQGHDPELPYQDEILPGSVIDLEHWQWWSHTDGGTVHYYAKGPCPACRADTQDHLADVPEPIEGLGRRKARQAPTIPSDTVEMPVRCRCGSDHGQPGTGGCGRRWSLIGPRTRIE